MIQQIGLFPHRTIADNIATVPKLLGWDKQRITDRVHELLDLIGLPQEMAKRYPAQLSGGQRQRVGVARALAADPPLMLMDEPFGAIDPINRDRLQNEFLRLQAEIRKTIVFVTHDIDEAIKMGDRIAILQVGGRLAQYAPPSELLLHPANAFVEDFVGADRALKRLALMRVGDLPQDALGTANGGPEIAHDALAARRAVATCSSTARCTAASSTRDGQRARLAHRRDAREAGEGVILAQLQIRERGGERLLRRAQRLLPGLDRRQLGALQDAADRAHRADADQRRDRVRDRVQRSR